MGADPATQKYLTKIRTVFVRASYVCVEQKGHQLLVVDVKKGNQGLKDHINHRLNREKADLVSPRHNVRVIRYTQDKQAN